MPTKRQFDMVVLTVLLVHAAVGLPKLWAARHATHDGIDGKVAGFVQVAM